MSILNKLEIDVMQASELREACELAHKYKLPALVVHPGLSDQAVLARGQSAGKFKLITPIDWPKGEVFGMTKLRGLSADALETDGFEILLTPGKNETETRNEASVISKFLRDNLSTLIEIRFVLGTHSKTPDEIATICRGLQKIPAPSLIRTDTQLKVQVGKANADTNAETVKAILDIIRAPIKISGNITDVRMITSCPEASKFAVSLLQAKNIIKEYSQQPEKLKQLLD